MFNHGLENILWNNCRSLERTLVANGRPVIRRINGFAVYQLRKPEEQNNSLGIYLAIRESTTEPNKVERAIFWEASSLEEAVAALSGLPDQPARKGKGLKDEIVSTSNAALTLALFTAAAYFAKSPEGGFWAAGIYNAARVAFHLWHSYSNDAPWQLAANGFSNVTEGRSAISAMLQYSEIYRVTS